MKVTVPKTAQRTTLRLKNGKFLQREISITKFLCFSERFLVRSLPSEKECFGSPNVFPGRNHL